MLRINVQISNDWISIEQANGMIWEIARKLNLTGLQETGVWGKSTSNVILFIGKPMSFWIYFFLIAAPE